MFVKLARIIAGYVAWVTTAAFAASFTMVAEGAFVIILIGAASFALIPFLICVTIAEVWSIRTKYYYMLSSLVPILIVSPRLVTRRLAAGLPPDNFAYLVLTGMIVGALVGSLAYWRIAGRHAGRSKPARVVSPSTAW